MLEVRCIRNTWGRFALKDVSLSVARGEYLVVLGPCGSGKTLLLETIAGLHRPAHGQVLIGGRDVTDLPPERRRVGLVYQQYALFPHLAVRDNIGYGLRYLGLSTHARRQRVDAMLGLLGITHLAERRRPAGLSGGEAQKVALARALAIEPELLLLDEPMSSLDQQARSAVTEVLADIGPRLGIPVVHVTHDYTEAAALARRVVVLRDGAVAQVGTVEEVFWRPASRYVAEFVGTVNVFAAELRCGGHGRTVLAAAGVELAVAEPGHSGPVLFCIRPDGVRVSAVPLSAVNVLAGVVREVRDRGFTMRVRVAVAFGEVVAAVPRQRFADLGVATGAAAFLELPPAELHLLPAAADATP